MWGCQPASRQLPQPALRVCHPMLENKLTLVVLQASPARHLPCASLPRALLPAACRFPGGGASYSAYIEMCDADVLAEGMIHCATTPACANRAFNVRGSPWGWCALDAQQGGGCKAARCGTPCRGTRFRACPRPDLKRRRLPLVRPLAQDCRMVWAGGGAAAGSAAGQGARKGL